MTYRIHRARADDAPIISRLQSSLLGVEYDRPAVWWIAWCDGEPVGFAGARLDRQHRAAFLVAAGVVPSHRRAGLHRRLLTARVRWARGMGVERVVTYTLVSNAASANGLIRARFKRSARWGYAGSDVEYWERTL